MLKELHSKICKGRKQKILIEVITPSLQRVKKKRILPLSAVKEYRGFSGILRAPGSLSLECGDRDDGAGSKRFEFACNRKTNQKVKCNFLGDLLMQ